MLKSLCRAVCLSALIVSVLACASRASDERAEDLAIIDSPTAGILPHGGYLFVGSIGPRSSLVFGVKVGFHDRLMVGASFGMQEFIGRGDIELNDKPGFELRLRLIEETVVGPALAVGIDTQGEDAYLEEAERYERKSKGFYAVVSKNYRFVGDLSLHGGANYSLEDRDEQGVNVFGGMSFGLFAGFSLLFDYNAALDDNDGDVATSLTRGRGYLDSGIQFDYMDNLKLKVMFKDLLGNYLPEKGVARSIEIWYTNYF
jgi:hypothetical protein